jgi:ELWxxDGT repeat protein
MGRDSGRWKRAPRGATASIEALEPRQLLSASVIKDIYPGGNEFAPGPSTVLHVGKLNLFLADDGKHGVELWRTDGTAVGTQMIADLGRGAEPFVPQSVAALGDQSFFIAQNALWRTDGTAAGTYRVQPDQRAQYFNNPRNLVAFKGSLYFTDLAADGAARLWRSDGTADGYTLVHKQNAFKKEFPGSIGALVEFGDALFFTQTDPMTGQGLWYTDGTHAGELAKLDVVSGFTPFHGALYFLAKFDGQLMLWRADGTPKGTVPIKTFTANAGKFQFGSGVVSGDTLYFAAADAEHGNELWKTDGTEAGTTLVTDLRPGTGYSDPEATLYIPHYEPPPTGSSGSVFTSVTTYFGDWNRPPEPGLSSRPANLVATSRGVFFTATFGNEVRLYHTDGTAEGTVRLDNFGDPEKRTITGLASIDGVVYIGILDSQYERGAIYATDGTQPGTRLVWNAPRRSWIHDYPAAAYGLANIDGSLFFTGYTPEAGSELMRFDDTGGITGVAYDDANGNGLRDRSELPLSGWRVFLDRNGDGAFNKGENYVFAGADGSYGFTAFPEGDYIVRVLPAEVGWTSSPVSALVRRGVTARHDVSAARATPAFGTIAGNVFKDDDFNGAFDASIGDGGFEGVRVYLDLNGNGFYNPGEPSTRSDADGNYRLGALPGQYRLAIVDLGPGHEYTQPMTRAMSVRANKSNRADFAIGYDGHDGVIRGVIFDDRDGDGVQDDNEPGISGATVFFNDTSSDIGSRYVATDTKGAYRFDGLSRGRYQVSTEAPSGSEWRLTTEVDLTPFALSPGGTAVRPWGMQRQGTASVAGTVFHDVNIDRAYSSGSDAGAVGWWVYADLDRDGKRDANEPSVQTTNTGEYRFDHLLSDTYLVRFVAPSSDWMFSDGAAAVEVGLKVGQARRLNAAVYQFGIATGQVFYDRAGDIANIGDPVKSGVTVFLDLNGDRVYQSGIERKTVTDAEGRYRFEGLVPGRYYAMPIAPSGWTVTSSVSSSEVTSASTTEFRWLNVSDHVAVRGRLVIDRDGNGSFTLNEGLRDCTVYVDLDDDGNLDANEPSATTSPVGSFTIGGLEYGAYVVRFVVPAEGLYSAVLPVSVTVTIPLPGPAPGTPVFLVTDWVIPPPA